MIFFCPTQNLPRFLKSRQQFTGFMLFFATSATLLSIVNPIVNAFALMFLAVPTYYLLFIELERVKHRDIKAYKLGIRTVVISTCAIIVWINDRVFCSFYTSINITYLHAVWHVLIFLWVRQVDALSSLTYILIALYLTYRSSYPLCVLFAYFFVHNEKPNTRCKLSFWPENSLNFIGIPYIEIEKLKPMSD